MKICLYQFNPVWEDKKSNQQKITDFLKDSIIDTDVLILPEMTLTGFTMRSKRFSETINGETVSFFQSIAKEKNIHIFAGFIEEENGLYLNTLFHINSEGKTTAKYQKIHPFSFSGENRHYDSGNNPVITNINNVKIGMSICYDLRFPELFRYYGKNRVDMMINIANWPVQRIGHWLHLLKARAIENLCFMIGVNRVGKDKGNEYNGYSGIYGPFGEEIVLLNKTEQIKTIDIDLKQVEKARQKFPFLEDIKLI